MKYLFERKDGARELYWPESGALPNSSVKGVLGFSVYYKDKLDVEEVKSLFLQLKKAAPFATKSNSTALALMPPGTLRQNKLTRLKFAIALCALKRIAAGMTNISVPENAVTSAASRAVIVTGSTILFPMVAEAIDYLTEAPFQSLGSVKARVSLAHG